MTEIVRGDGMKYALAYNAFHNLESIRVDGKSEPLVLYTYKDGNGRLKQITYANGDIMKVTYNSIGQMNSEKWYNAESVLTAHYKYVYDGQGNIVRSIDLLGRKEYNYIYEDGNVVRAAEYNIAVNADEIVIAKRLIHSIIYAYDTEGRLSNKRIVPETGTEQVIKYTYAENGDLTVQTQIADHTFTSSSRTDGLGRKRQEELNLGRSSINYSFSYHPGQVTEKHQMYGKVKGTATTQLVHQIVMGGYNMFTYWYDEEGRIAGYSDLIMGGKEYTYDALGQLIKETGSGVTNDMTYDNYGNILSKNGIAYTYGDAVWKDKLTAYGDQTITYDAQGNPVSYLGHALTWEKGRQLKSFDNIQYTYNANGIRTSKTVDGVKHTYMLDGTKILSETWGENTLIPLYDNEDSVCGIFYNNVPYYFYKNLQGDVIAITDQNGSVMAQYTYDAWGVCSIYSDDSGCNLANVNPFRYRGYYYDVEIGMYYLQSRYYDPVVGRFINGDVSEYAVVSFNVCGHNLFTYCENDIVNNSDEMGYYTGSLVLKASLIARLSKALSGIMTSVRASKASIKAAMATSWSIPICIAATTIAIAGIIYTVNKVKALFIAATTVISAVKEKIRKNGVDSKKLKNYSVYVIYRKHTVDVVYVGITKNYKARERAHKKRFPTSKYTMLPIATGLSKAQARAMEQTIITAYTIDTLRNMINSISPKKWGNFKTEFQQMETLIQSWLDPE